MRNENENTSKLEIVNCGSVVVPAVSNLGLLFRLSRLAEAVFSSCRIGEVFLNHFSGLAGSRESCTLKFGSLSQGAADWAVLELLPPAFEINPAVLPYLLANGYMNRGRSVFYPSSKMAIRVFVEEGKLEVDAFQVGSPNRWAQGCRIFWPDPDQAQ